MGNDRFFTQTKCDRCYGELKVRTASWFTEETICQKCSKEETEIRRRANKLHGQDFEGCNMHIVELRKMVGM